MKLRYYQQTNTLYIEFKDGPTSDTNVLVEGLVADFDANGQVIGLEIDNWEGVDLADVELEGFPAPAKTIPRDASAPATIE